MKITRIAARNFLKLRASDMTLGAVNIFCGPNGSGKSSVRDALDFCLTGNPGRADNRKAYADNLTEGEQSGAVAVEYDGKICERDVASGKAASAALFPEALPYCLRSWQFASMSELDRRAFLYGLMGISLGPEEIKKRLIQRGIDDALIERVLPLLSGGFAPALTEAERRRVEAKAKWHEVTGEVYGSKKAVAWFAPAVPFSPAELEAVRDKCAVASTYIDRLNQVAGKLALIEKNRQRIASLRIDGKNHSVYTEALNNAQRSYDAYVKELKELPEPAPVQAVKPDKVRSLIPQSLEVQALACVHCGGLNNLKGGKLVEYVKPETKPPTPAEPEPQPPPVDDTATIARRAFLRKEIERFNTAIADSKADISRCEQAIKQADEMEAQLAQETAIDAGDKINKQLADARAQLTECREEERALMQRGEAAASAEKKTKRAGELHAEVVRWDVLCAALAPDGIPAQILADALGPINGALNNAATGTGWRAVVIGDDMSIKYGGRRYSMLAENEQWRVDAMISYAIAAISGVRLLILDRFDVLDIPSRGQALAWIQECADDGLIDTALIMATLKAPPQIPDVSVFWMGEK